MRIRTQLILAAFVLAVVPLAAIVTYSYHSSRRALESAYRHEADRLTRQMDHRLATIRAELDQRVSFVSALGVPTSSDVNAVGTVMGETASLVDALDFEPLRALPSQPAQPEPAARAAEPHVANETSRPHEQPEKADRPEAPEPPEVDDADDAGDAGDEQVAPPAPPREPIVIDLPAMPEFPHYTMSEEQKELIGEIGRLGTKLGTGQLSEEERQDIREELKAAQKELRRVVAVDRAELQAQVAEAVAEQRARQRQIDRERRARGETPAGAHPVPAPAPAPAPAIATAAPAPVKHPPSVVKIHVRDATAKDLAKAADTSRRTALILGRRFEAPVRREGEVVGNLRARISPEQVIRRVLGGASEDRLEIPFALDREGTLYTRTTEESTRLEKLGVPRKLRSEQSVKGIEGWIVSTSTDPQSGLRIGVARPVGDNLDELKNTAARNFSLGLGLIVFALIGIVPLSNHLTRDVKLVTDGAERIAQGDLMTRLPVKTDNELGQLARAFNRMAEDLSIHQQKLVEQERARKEQELQQRLMSVEYERKSVELEDARRFQLSMLPKEVPVHPGYDVAVFTRTATEVGGDYYDFHLAGDTLSVTIGDATGHGAKAGTMVTVIKTLFSGYGGTAEPALFLADAAEKIRRMELGRMAMALSLARLESRKLTVASAGMPPVFIHRAAAGSVEEIALEATPLGTMRTDYPQTSTELAAGDTVLFLSDGFPELMNEAGQQLGYSAALDAFAAAATAVNADAVIAALSECARAWHGDTPPNDDVTFVVVRVA